jgi:mannosyl-oligosaccharide glucosidase
MIHAERRGPIWININYLALSALKHYGSITGPHQQRIQKLYAKLRTGIVLNIFDQYRETGHFWEQYDDQTGKGIRGHPFTGWTAMVVNILFELY